MITVSPLGLQAQCSNFRNRFFTEIRYFEFLDSMAYRPREDGLVYDPSSTSVAFILMKRSNVACQEYLVDLY